MIKDIINCLFCDLPRHTFFRIFSYKITIFTRKLTILSYDKGYSFCFTFIPYIFFFDYFHK